MKRRGYTIIELVAVIFLTSLMLSILGAIFQLLFQTSSSQQKTLTQTSTVARLAEAFRLDCRQSAGFSLSDEGVELQLQLPDERAVVYLSQGGKVTRTVLQSDKPIVSDVFKMGNGSKVTVLELEQPSRMLQLVVAPNHDAGLNSTGPPSHFTIQAQVGAHTRFQQKEQGK